MSSRTPQFLASLVFDASRLLHQRLQRIPDISSHQNHCVALRTSFRLCQQRFEAVGQGLVKLPAEMGEVSHEEALAHIQVALNLCDEISSLLERDIGFLLRVLDKYKSVEEKALGLVAESIVTELVKTILSVVEGINAYVAEFDLVQV